ncbi:hypothetical protein [Thiomicrorhabdus lithotrophica]|uniref:Lipoprotein n=1 Tax=Thiomicrorhabdus lithotrophica TaxID=2949997 RepID=A0ABY8CEU5_9GAMM|nr:hypothetical protein [Thiomicrorhabdus lithotrophica]WEJ62628.1 hypothetical protein NR989_11530 [Thiomicrorhabdus lithotrophica]
MKIQYRLKTLATIIPIVLAGCVSQPMHKSLGVSSGDIFALSQVVEIPANSTRIFIQNGKLTSKNGFDHSEQHCRIEVTTLSEHKQRVLPEKFQIISVTTDEEQIALMNTKPILLALNNTNGHQSDYFTLKSTLGFGSQERPETMDLIHINLASKKQPNVMRLTCAGSLSNGDMADAPRSYRPDLNTINKILGSIGYISTEK